MQPPQEQPLDQPPMDSPNPMGPPPPPPSSPLVFAFALVPVCDLLAGYFNYDTWNGLQDTDSTTDPYLATITAHWSSVYLGEFVFGLVGLGALGGHVSGAAPAIVFNALSKVHILVDASFLYVINKYKGDSQGSQDLITPTNSTRNTMILHGVAIAGAIVANVGLMMAPKEEPVAEEEPVEEEPIVVCDPYYESCL